MSYREHAPPAALAPWLECVWERRGDGAPVRVLPDGCVDVVWTEGDDTLIVGANTSAFIVPLAPGTRVAGARFAPGAGPALLGLAAEELRDAKVAIEEVRAGDGARLAAQLDSHADPASGLVEWLSTVARDAPRPDPVVRAVVDSLRHGPTDTPLSVGRLAEQLALSERQLRRRVAAAVGYGPKLLVRVLRLYRALDAARAGDELARVAADAGYADQAHFANECRELAGAPATVLLQTWTERDRFLQDGARGERDHARHDYPTTNAHARLGDRVRGRSPGSERLLPADVRPAR